MEPWEKCDDSNIRLGDGCSGTCRVEDSFLCEGGSKISRDYCTCEPRDEKAVFSQNWEEIYIIYDKRLKLYNTPFETNTPSKDFCEYIFEKITLAKLGVGYKCGFYGRFDD